tara:strand:+ start:172 stop:618 length:447 start_codon:yes stop_codon:yes gene_type:complete
MFENDEDVKTSTTQKNYASPDARPTSSLAPQLPLANGVGEQYRMIRDYRDLAIQNFKMILLTSPGERVMDSNFGVGIRNFLFELESETVKTNIARRIESQAFEYAPYITVTSITYPQVPDRNLLSIKIKFTIDSIGVEEEIMFSAPII